MNTRKIAIKTLGLLMVAAMLLAFLPAGEVMAQPDTGWYTGEGPYTLTSADQLAGLAQLVNNGTDSFNGKTILLGNDINLSTYSNWVPIGTSTNPFKGTFDGQNYKITNLTIDTPNEKFVGLFGKINPGTVTNLGLEDVTLVGLESVGGLAGSFVTGSVTNVHAKNVVINSTHWAGGLVGYSYASYFNSSVENVTVTLAWDTDANDNGDKAGGIVGYQGEGDYNFTNCTATNVDITGVRDVGGLVGAVQYGNTFTNCQVINGLVTADETTGSDSSPWAGGLIGRAVGSPIHLKGNSVTNVTVSSYDPDYAGPVVGGPLSNVIFYVYNETKDTWHATIQAAIDAASPGDTVTVGPGTYAENVVINKANLTLQSTTPQGAVISPESGKIIVINASGVTLDGFKLEYSGNIGNPGIQLSGANASIVNNHIIGYNDPDVGVLDRSGSWTTNQGILFSGTNDTALIQDNVIYYWYTGVFNQASTSVQFVGNDISHNRTGTAGDGVTNVTYTNNTFEDNYSSVSFDVAASNLTITGNSFSDNYRGITFRSYEGISVTENTFTDTDIPVRDDTGELDLVGILDTNSFDRAALSGSVIYSSIQAAIDTASDGDTILVGPGTYPEQLELRMPNITVQSMEGRDATFIDVPHGSLTVGVKVLANMGTVTFEGFTVQNFTESGIVQGMSAREGTTFHVLNNKVIPYADYLRNGIQVSGDGSTVIGNYVEGAYLTEDWAATAIGVVNASDVLVEGNEISGAVNGIDFGIAVYTWNYDDSIVETLQNVQVLNNTIYNVDYPLDVTAYTGTISNITFKNNRVTEYVEPLWAGPYTEPGYDGVSVTNVDASPNWWGSIMGPMGPITGDVDYIPWCGDPECTFLVPDQEIVLEGEITDTVVINNPGITIFLKDSTEIDADGPCFEVNADNITIKTESPGGALCYPGSDGVVVADGVDQFELIGLEIDGTGMGPGNGVHFLGEVSNVWLIDNFIHDVQGDGDTTGHGVYFAEGLGGTVNSIQGNLFMNNAGNGIEAGTHAIDARYNAWGHVLGAEEGDGASAGVDTSNHTHADLYLESSGTVYADQVVLGEQIVYTVYGNLANISGVEIDLTHSPEPLGYVEGSFEYNLDLFDVAGVDYTSYQVSMYGYQWVEEGSGPVEGITTTEPTWLFRVAFTGLQTCKTCSAGFEGLAEFAFAHTQIDGGPTNNVYPAALIGVDPIEVIELPVLSQEGLDDPLTAGIERNFTVRLVNSETGGEFDTVLVNFFIPGATLADIYSFECFDQTNDVWLGDLLSEDGAGNLVGSWGPPSGFPLTVPYDETTLCRVTVNTPREYAVEITLDDLATDWELARLEIPVVVNAGDYSVTGTVSMQGRTVRSGVPMTLTSEIFGPYEEISGSTMIGNLVFSGLDGGTYQITTLQPRYLNIHEGLGLSIYMDDDYELPPLHLYGGNANWGDNVIDILDASTVGAAYGWTGDTTEQNADVNFDGRVNIQDLALVGGNFDLTSAAAYGEWISPVLEGVSPAPGHVVLGADENFVWVVDALDMDDNLYKLEIDHSLEDYYPEFSVYASEENPYGTEDDRQQFEAFGVTVTYDAVQQAWTFDFGADLTDGIIGYGGITFYVVLKDTAGNQWGTMYGTTPENTFAYTISRE